METSVYQQLLRINRSFDAVHRALTKLAAIQEFHRSELRCIRALTEEVRASTNSYVAAVIETAESDKGGRLFHRRLQRKKRDDRQHTPREPSST